MPNPLLIAGMGMQVAGGVSGYKGGKASAKSAAQAAAFNNQVIGQNNKILAYQDVIGLAQLERQAQLQIAVGQQQVSALREQYKRQSLDNQIETSFADFFGRAQIATQTATSGASGVSVNEGSSLITRLVQESMLSKQLNKLKLTGQYLADDAQSQIASAKFNQAVGLQNLAGEAAIQRTTTQINMYKNTVSAMENTIKGQGLAAKARAQGTAALLSGLGSAASTCLLYTSDAADE